VSGSVVSSAVVTGAVLDASALLALLNDEDGADEVERALGESICVMSAVNWAEVLSKLSDLSPGAEQASVPRLVTDLLSVEFFGPEDAEEVAGLRAVTRSSGLSLGDRACLALAGRLGWPAWTADRAWREIETDVEVHLVR